MGVNGADDDNENGRLARVPWPPVLLVSFVALGWWAGWVLPASLGLWADAQTLGALGIMLAVGVDVWAVATLVRARTTVLPTSQARSLVVNGPFRWSRHPIYVANTFALGSIGLWQDNGWFVLLALVYAVLLRSLCMIPEERLLAQQFGQDWQDYASRVHRWMGRRADPAAMHGRST